MTKRDRTGESRTMNNGLSATIVNYRNAQSIDVSFENGLTVYSNQYWNFKNGNIKCPLLIASHADFAEITNVNTESPIKWLMDIEDLPKLGGFLWYSDGNGYIQRSLHPAQTIMLHRTILNAPEDVIVDHIDGNILDNRKRNLRYATRSENNWNRKVSSSNTSGYNGVSLNKNSQKWVARIGVMGKRIFLGQFFTPEQAALAYNEAAVKYHGEFALLNDIPHDRS